MSRSVIRRSLIGAVVAAGLGVGASGAQASAVTLKVSSSSVWFGSSVTATITSDTSGTISLYQLRSAAYQGGSGRCSFGSTSYVAGLTYDLGKPVTKVAITAGKPVSVSIAGSKLQYFGGSVLDSVYHPDPNACTDPATQFTKLGAFLDITQYVNTPNDIRSLTRTL